MAIRFTEKEYKEFLGEPHSGNLSKYRNRKVEYDGHKFDSEFERDRYAELKLLERAGDISDLKLQPVFELIPPIKEDGKTVQRAVRYRADFSYLRNGELIVEDTKSEASVTSTYILKKKLMRFVHGIEIKEIYNK